MTVLTETRERYLLTIAAQVPVERIAEIHFFQPIKQGGVESGVAVVAAWSERQASETPAEDVSVAATDEVEIAVGDESDAAGAGAVADATIDSTESAIDAGAEDVRKTASEAANDAASDAANDGAGDSVTDDASDSTPETANDTANDTANETESAAIEASSDASDAAVADNASDVVESRADGTEPDERALSGIDSVSAEPTVNAEPVHVRHTIYTARYRLTLKGPDRGKWESNVVAEADAPLVTVDAVVRGVQRRSGDVDDATRLDGDEVRALIDAKRARMVGVKAGAA